MYIPKGYTEQQVIDDINHVVAHLSHHFKFGLLDEEDIRQEGWVEALKALKKYKSNKNTSLRTFLYTHVRNRFINMRRNKCISQSNPCIGCGFRHKKLCREFKNKNDCEKYAAWQLINKRKLSLIKGHKFIDDSDTYAINSNELEKICNKEMFTIIDKHIPYYLRDDYCRFMHGARLSKQKKEKLIAKIKQILKQYNYL